MGETTCDGQNEQSGVSGIEGYSFVLAEKRKEIHAIFTSSLEQAVDSRNVSIVVIEGESTIIRNKDEGLKSLGYTTEAPTSKK